MAAIGKGHRAGGELVSLMAQVMRRKLLLLLLGIIAATALIQGVGILTGEGWSWIYAAGAGVAAFFVVSAIIQAKD